MFLHIDFNNSINQVKIDYSPKLVSFKDDNSIVYNSEYTVISEGYYLGRTPSESDIVNEINNYEEFTNKFKGSFIIVYYNKITNEAIIANDLLSKLPVYYYKNEKNFICSSSFIKLYEYLKTNSYKFTIDNNAINDILNNSFFKDNNTYITEIKYLRAFEYISVNANVCINKINYPKPIENISIEEASHRAYSLFSQAAKLQIDKNIINQKDQIISLSGGMDTRAVFMQLVKIAKNNITAFTYAQSNSKDDIISKQIVKDNNIKNHLFYPLDNCEFIYDKQLVLNENEGQMYYCGSTGAYKCVQKLNLSNVGLIHMGVGGGEIFGDINKSEYESPFEGYPKYNYKINIDDIRCCLNSVYTISSIASCASPFLYEDLFKYLMSLPYEIKQRRRLYVEIFNKYMYNSYDTTMFRGKIGKKRSLISRAFTYYKSIIFKNDVYDMNPFDKWWINNKQFKNYINEEFSSDIIKLKDLNFNTSNIELVFNTNNTINKLRALTVSSMLCKILK